MYVLISLEKGLTPSPRGHALLRRHASSHQPHTPRQGALPVAMRKFTFRDVSGAIVGNSDKIYGEETTQAFSGAIVGKCSQNSRTQ